MSYEYEHRWLELPPRARGLVRDFAGALACGAVSFDGPPAGTRACTWDVRTGRIRLLDSGIGSSFANAGAPDGTVGGWTLAPNGSQQPAVWSLDGAQAFPATRAILEGVVSRVAVGMQAALELTTLDHATTIQPYSCRLPAAPVAILPPRSRLVGRILAMTAGGACLVELTDPSASVDAAPDIHVWHPGDAAGAPRTRPLLLPIPDVVTMRASDMNDAGTVVLHVSTAGAAGAVSEWYAVDVPADPAEPTTWMPLGLTTAASPRRPRCRITDTGTLLTSDGWLRPTGGAWHRVPLTARARAALGSDVTYVGISDDGHIVGETPAGPFVLDQVPAGLGRATREPRIASQLLGAVAVDGGGAIIVNGRVVPVPPWDPTVRDAMVALAVAELAGMHGDPVQRAALAIGAADALAATAERMRHDAKRAQATAPVVRAEAPLPAASVPAAAAAG